MRVDTFDYCLPPELIAQRPLSSRTQSRLLVLPAEASQPIDTLFSELPAWMRRGDLLVLNDTRVLKARLHGSKQSGGRVELLVERLLSPRRMLAHVRSSKSPRVGSHLLIGDCHLEVIAREHDLFLLEVAEGVDLNHLMQRHGRLPLPPYIDRSADSLDDERYQTVFAREDGAVAAPTAGLHLDEAMLAVLADAGVNIGFLTLHVGAGTFKPVRADDVEAHVMHAERYRVSKDLCEQVAQTRAGGGRVIAVGTTCVRALESSYAEGQLMPTEGDTRLFIRPGYRFKCVDAMITNFHLPKSTLLMLVSAFSGTQRVLDAYRHAIANRYRFFSYGDATMLFRRDSGDDGVNP